jgi:plastocyanin
MDVRRSASWSRLILIALALSGPACRGKSSTEPPGTTIETKFNFTFPGMGATHAFTFTQAGDWAYHCSTHQVDGMTGTIFVRASSTRTTANVAVGPFPTPTFVPDTVTIGINGVVTWVNPTSATNHTVTRP